MGNTGKYWEIMWEILGNNVGNTGK